MAHTDYPGIDYSDGKVNRDPETGIHYGIISIHSLYECAVEDFEPDYGAPTCPKCGNPATDILHESLPDVDEWEHARGECEEYACAACEYVFGSESAYGDEPIGYTLDDGTYKGALDDSGDVWLFDSPYYTHAQFCSPCAPGAGHLDSPCACGPKTYCFGHDRFDGGKAPYPVYSVATGELIDA